MAHGALGFGVLGPLQLSANGTEVPLGAAKQRAVLARLLINRNRIVPMDSLIDAAWQERPPPEARASLHVHISRLRRLMSGAGEDAAGVLVSVQSGYRLNVPDEAFDLGRFAAKQKAGIEAAAAGRFDEASRHLSAALAEWRGPVLEDLRDFEFVPAFAAALIEDKLVALTARAEAEIACGRIHSTIGELEPLASEHPYREPLWAQLITAYYLAERQYDALDAYARLKASLANDLGIDPGPTLRGLHQRILRQEPLDTKNAARATAKRAVGTLQRRPDGAQGFVVAQLRDSDGRRYPLRGATTRIGRLVDNDIVLDDDTVSRHHAVIVDTGNSLVITDLGSANGVDVAGQRIRISATLAEGDRIGICGHEFTFEIGAT
ncbi:BTAD domain-containing putative transcriptional regulator [Mycobacterium sp. 852002-51057_SCH5723018]|uniref:BTAD domain-containing putative transcriptional regulator n=1 Tax=Mycobacterium sp. 852002-51057_SCH5723018 TaxID=1834094 RepID=UPI0008004BBB|nr:BTAD domain-containing putative transcriptional regulator [Mycobacterium sp. 852002-51057_SCH5723018]OBG19266.1 regulator [Mycobacterium sp. 852002-51057_SCH5723018]